MTDTKIKKSKKHWFLCDGTSKLCYWGGAVTELLGEIEKLRFDLEKQTAAQAELSFERIRLENAIREASTVLDDLQLPQPPSCNVRPIENKSKLTTE